jgi:hypothetical protein
MAECDSTETPVIPSLRVLIRCADVVRDSVIDSIIFTGGFVAESPNLRWCVIGLTEERLAQQEDAGEEKEEGDQAEGGAGCGHG